MSTPSFKHEPLDHTQPSIRVLRVSRLSSKNGLIRCKIKHTTINSKYTCLSCRWGEPNDGGGPFDILVNNKIYKVRQNLYQFLQRAKDRFLGWLLIDAICIDQDNTKERNHQVRHMGEIYSRAIEVLVWLGDSSDVARFLHSASPWWFRLSHFAQSGEYSVIAVSRTTHSYWQRAWVTREIVLARRIKFMAGAVIAPPESLKKPNLNAISPPELQSLGQLLNLSTKRRVTHATDLKLIQLLELMQYKQCSFPRNKIYSPLALCKDGRGMVVDYDQSDAAFLCHALNSLSSTFCLCMARLLAECVVHRPLGISEGPQRDTHFEKSILEMKLKPVSIRTRRREVMDLPKMNNLGAEKFVHECCYCNVDLGKHSQKGYRVFCLRMICATAEGHLFRKQSDAYVLLYQRVSYRTTGERNLWFIPSNWGSVYASKTAKEEHVLRFTLQGLSNILWHIWMRSRYHRGISDIKLCRFTRMGVPERTKSEFGGWSILDLSMSEQDDKLDG